MGTSIVVYKAISQLTIEQNETVSSSHGLLNSITVPGMKFPSVDHTSQSSQMCASWDSLPGRSILQHSSPALRPLVRFLPQQPA